MEVVDGAKASEEQAASPGLCVSWGHARGGGLSGSPPGVLGAQAGCPAYPVV